jgi:hypothetical protein
MTIAFTCPHCQTTSQIDEAFAGQSGPCARCGAKVTVPMRSGAPSGHGRSISTGAIVVVVVALGGLLAIVLCGVGLYLPAVQSTSKPSPTLGCKNNLKQIAIALHNYHDTYQTFPPAYIADEDGQPMHSWRVLILPFIEGGSVYQQYDFDQPWNSAANLAVYQVQPSVYQCPGDSGSCSYFLVNVPDGIFEGDQQTKIAEITDGTSNTIMVVEVTGANVHWAEPYDLGPQALTAAINSAADGTAISSVHVGGAHVVFADASVHFVADNVPPATVQALITKSDGQAVRLP